MKQEHFEALHAREWDDFSAWLKHAAGHRKRGEMAPFPAAEMPRRYRLLCQQLALARDRDYSVALVERLHALAQQAHDVLYGPRSGFLAHLIAYAAGGFAADVRAHWRWVLASFLLLFGPMFAVMAAIHVWPDFALLLMTPEQLANYESMYSDARHSGGKLAREAATDFQMFGFYIFNNVSLAFRCFAGGITAGVLTVISLVFNGVMMGAVEARLVQAGLGHNFYSFVVGHTAFELGGIVIAGAAGLRLGAALLIPGRRTRGRALRETARSLIGMVCGMAVMLFAAALVEAFWSPLRFDLWIKLSVGGGLLLLTLAYFVFAGRARPALDTEATRGA